MALSLRCRVLQPIPRVFVAWVRFPSVTESISEKLLDILETRNRFLKRRVQLIACGGTAMTLLGVKASTKDVDFMTPEIKKYNYLIKQLQAFGYERLTGSGWKRDGDVFHFDIFIAMWLATD